MMEPAVEFNHVTKIYNLGAASGSLRQALVSLPRRLLRHRESESSQLIALNDLSLSIDRGESIGFIGPNGSGKTTTLKLISNIIRATSGSVKVSGRVSALIELGAGFHPDLTGRENVYFNAAILGMRQNEIQKRFDEIVDFSGLERFLDTPVKRYSSGMYCRLGFAVAGYVNPDILLIDEVLAVGDRAFQIKCFKRMSDLQGEGTTIVFVTHSLGYLERLCNRSVFLYQGNVLADGPVSEVIEAYRNHEAYNSPEKKATCSDECEPEGSPEVGKEISAAEIVEVFFSSAESDHVTAIKTGDPLDIHLVYQANQPIQDANFEIWIYGMDGTEYTTFATIWDQADRLDIFGQGEICLRIDHLGLMPGTYFVNVAVSTNKGLHKFDSHWEKHRLLVLDGPTVYGMVFQPHRWVLEKTEMGERLTSG